MSIQYEHIDHASHEVIPLSSRQSQPCGLRLLTLLVECGMDEGQHIQVPSLQEKTCYKWMDDQNGGQLSHMDWGNQLKSWWTGTISPLSPSRDVELEKWSLPL